MATWILDVCEERSRSLDVSQSPFPWIVTGTLTHFKERGYLLLHSMTIYNHEICSKTANIWGGSHGLQSNKPKRRKIFLPGQGIESRTFQSLVFFLECYFRQFYSYFPDMQDLKKNPCFKKWNITTYNFQFLIAVSNP